MSGAQELAVREKQELATKEEPDPTDSDDAAHRAPQTGTGLLVERAVMGFGHGAAFASIKPRLLEPPTRAPGG